MDLATISAISSAILGTIIIGRANRTPATRICPTCHSTIDGTATACPHCRRKVPHPKLGLGVWIAATGGIYLAITIVLILLGFYN